MEEWSSVVLDLDHVASMSSRLRQHLFRVHELHARDSLAEKMKSRARTILCELLHDRPANSRLAPDQVCVITGEFGFVFF